MEDKITMMQALDYEVKSSWWSGLIFWNWGRDLAGTYFANKVKRKYRRYTKSVEHQNLIKNLNH